MTTFTEWLDETTENASASDIAERTGFHQATVYRWRNGTIPPCEALFAITRQYDGDVIAGMMAAGYMLEEDFERSIEGGLKRTPTERLWAEILRRSGY